MKKQILSTLAISCLLSLSPIASISRRHNLLKPQVVYAKINNTESHQSMVNIANSLADKNDLQSRENNLIQAAQTDVNDTATARNTDNSKTTQKDLKNYQKQSGQLTKIAVQADKKVKKEKSLLNPSDYKKLRNYNKALDRYINDLEDYASTLESEGAVSSDPDASKDDKKDAQNDITKTQNKFNRSKTNWLNQYSVINDTQN
ncbi:hypothetical protein [Limosilactobacillus sp.]|jgi:hypothetical protein|uniref:hypothetical protein n=1 Tax=Limosilactobacillus sp. TaxID=2773925 RepID=UPI0025C66385|nr:hypothetical protein [Limosilactobacillus sp.]MCH3922930.1 hypothetical protein [Limosilactobacillus sp.]MCH3927613.1 hypothetical protein [Limosilactobacillus sp.]